jgi:hypothetical protein
MGADRAELTAHEIMQWFVQDSGLDPSTAQPRRYLWTDAFAVCNLIGLFESSGSRAFLDRARQLIDQVHVTLGRHRLDDVRTGWISGLGEAEGMKHPTCGGLRIGKPHNERAPNEPFDETLEWDRDGQYYHYLTKWAHALCRYAEVTGSSLTLDWAADLAMTMHRAFCWQSDSSGARPLFWKMSIDLSRPQVESMGHHDPLDGLLTTCHIHCMSCRVGLVRVSDELTDMCLNKNWATGDPLGIGGLLFDAHRFALLQAAGCGPDVPGLFGDLLTSAAAGLNHYLSLGSLRSPAHQRLPFRELGLAIGLRALPHVVELIEESPALAKDIEVRQQLGRLLPAQEIASIVVDFWLDRAHHTSSTWQQHRDINMVMLATSLEPGGFLGTGRLKRLQGEISDGSAQ